MKLLSLKDSFGAKILSALVAAAMFPTCLDRGKKRKNPNFIDRKGKIHSGFSLPASIFIARRKGKGKQCVPCATILFVGMASLPKHSLFPLLPRSLSRSRNLAEGPFVPLDSSLSAAEWVGLGAIKFVMKWSLPPSLLAILAQRGCHPSPFLTLTPLKPLVRTFEPPIDGGGGGGGRWRLNDIILNLTPPPLLPKQSEKRGRGGGRFYFLPPPGSI